MYTNLYATVSQFIQELPTRMFLLLFIFNDDPGYGRGAWYKSLQRRPPTEYELEEAKFDPKNYRTSDIINIEDGHKTITELRQVTIL